MLEKLPDAVGHALESVRPGPGKAVFNAPAFASAPATIRVSSAAFAEGGTLPIRFTDDGAGTSPPLAWTQVPAETGAIVLLIEDVDCPAPTPLVHAIAWNLPGQDGGLPEGGLPSKDSPGEGGIAMGRNSFFKPEYLAPDPPPGHGPHRYFFQVFAVREPLLLEGHPDLHTVVKAMTGQVTARGLLVGIYERV